MKRHLLFLFGLIISTIVLADVPQGISHQAVMRDADNNLIVESPIGLQISILQGAHDGYAVYVETHNVTTNTNGLITYIIGEGDVIEGVFEEIDWGAGPYWLKTEADPDGEANYTISGVTQFLSVPYALHSKTAEAIKDGSSKGEFLFWNGYEWLAVVPGQYGQTLSFCDGVPTWGPCPPAVPVVNTTGASSITDISASSGGVIIDGGSSFVSVRGIVWDTNEYPTLEVNLGQLSLGSGTGSFSGNMTGLTPETEYFARAFATNNQGTAYGNQVSFTTEPQTVFLPTVTTAAVTEITQTSAFSGGEVTDDGDAPVTARGVVWHTSSNPTIENNLGQTSDGSGIGSYVSEIIELQPNTGYYVRAYAVNSQGVSYGNQRVFVTQQDGNLPTVVTAEATEVTQTTATTGGEVTDDGGSHILARGVCWSAQESPTLFDNYIESGAGLGDFTSELTGLVAGTTYFVRAFATSSQGVAYGNQVSFTTDVGTANVKIVSLNIAQAGLRVVDAEVLHDGGANVTTRGFVWDIQENPTLEQNEGFSTDGSGLGEFTAYLEDLTPNTKYYIRAYASNSEGAGYSDQMSFHFWDYHDIVTDFDGNVYQTILIGNQEWMAEELRTTSYKNGIPIPTGLNNEQWQSTNQGAYAIYPHENIYGLSSSEEVVLSYGKLYNWYAVNDARGLCPEGWRVPSHDEWSELYNYLVNNYSDVLFSNVGNFLKSCRQQNSPLGGNCNTTEHPRWNSNSDHYGTNSFGFSAFAGGLRSSSGFYMHITSYGDRWTSTENSYTKATFHSIRCYIGGIDIFPRTKTYGSNVRCIKD